MGLMVAGRDQGGKDEGRDLKAGQPFNPNARGPNSGESYFWVSCVILHLGKDC